MAGGIFTSQNKIRPGAYLNFKAVSTPTVLVGSRGIVTFATELDWGDDSALIDVYSTDLTSGDSLAKVGLTAFDEKSKLINLALQNAYLLKLYRLNSNGVKANGTIGNLTITAKYSGIFGNTISVTSKKDSNIYEISTYANGYAVDTQRVSEIEQLVNNDYVVFSGEGALSNGTVKLDNGTNGTSSNDRYTSYFNLLKTSQWQTMALPTDEEAVNTLAVQFIKQMREDEGKYVQLVVANNSTADYEGIINNVCGAVIDGVSINATMFTTYVAGITAGASITESNTGKIVEGATEIINPLGNDDIIKALNSGKLVLSTNQDGAIKIEKDINSLHTFTPDRNYAFSKNRVIRILDEIGTSISNIWERTYLGKVSNDELGRTLFKSSIINYLSTLENEGAIQNFDSSTVEVELGNNVDVVLASITIQPVDSMEILYMTINVNG